MTTRSDGGPLRVAMFHNRYTRAGGEDASTRLEAELLRDHGHDVALLEVGNQDVLDRGLPATLAALWRSAFNRRAYRRVRAFCRRHRPHVAHVQNFWFALSPSVHAACHAEGVATVQTLRNYRLLCLNALLLRDGGPCEDCVGRVPWPGVVHRCYRGSALQSILVARMLVHNRRRHTWTQDVDVFLALTDFARQRFVAGGLEAEKLLLKPNFAPDPGTPAAPGEGALFLGRLSEEKGIDLLLDAWSQGAPTHLTLVGDGPLRQRVEAAATASGGRIRALGHRPAPEVRAALRRAAFLVMASPWYEGFPRVLVEAFASGRAAVVPRLGSMAEIVDHGRTGLVFESGDAADLARQVRRLAADPEECARLGAAARREYLERYSPQINHAQLVAAYGAARTRFADAGGGRSRYADR